MKFKLCTLLLSLILIGQNSIAASFDANAKTKRIPAGTEFSIQLSEPITSNSAFSGISFSALLLEDQKTDYETILPKGSLIRGTVEKIVPAKRLSQGAIMYLDFDHIVAPNGRHLPISMSVVGQTNMTYDGGITTTRGYTDAMGNSWETTKDIVKTSVDWGNDNFEDVGGGYWRIITLPVSAIGGGIGGAGYYVYSGVANAIKKGEDVILKQNEVLKVILINPVDVPVI
ncbi:MAG: hypothetical protein R3Y28_06620 [Candidatus Gastranaerophilales bacterium]